MIFDSNTWAVETIFVNFSSNDSNVVSKLSESRPALASCGDATAAAGELILLHQSQKLRVKTCFGGLGQLTSLPVAARVLRLSSKERVRVRRSGIVAIKSFDFSIFFPLMSNHVSN